MTPYGLITGLLIGIRSIKKRAEFLGLTQTPVLLDRANPYDYQSDFHEAPQAPHAKSKFLAVRALASGDLYYSEGLEKKLNERRS